MHIFLRMGPPCRMMDHCSVGFSSQSTLVPFRLLVHDKLPGDPKSTWPGNQGTQEGSGPSEEPERPIQLIQQWEGATSIGAADAFGGSWVSSDSSNQTWLAGKSPNNSLRWCSIYKCPFIDVDVHRFPWFSQLNLHWVAWCWMIFPGFPSSKNAEGNTGPNGWRAQSEVGARRPPPFFRTGWLLRE
jgi:hypothetical protein